MEKNIPSILDSLDGLQKASPGPYFYTRVEARMQCTETGFWGSMASFITRPSIALATLALVFLLNAAAFFYQRQQGSTSSTDQTEQTMMEDYNTTLAANSYYDENTEAHP